MVQQSSSRSRSWRRPRCTLDFIPDTLTPAPADTAVWVAPSRSTARTADRYGSASRSTSDRRHRDSSIRAPSGSSANGSDHPVRTGQRRVRRRRPPAPVMIDDHVPGHPVQPRGRIVHRRPRADQAQQHLLRQILRGLRVLHPRGDERPQPGPHLPVGLVQIGVGPPGRRGGCAHHRLASIARVRSPRIKPGTRTSRTPRAYHSTRPCPRRRNSPPARSARSRPLPTRCRRTPRRRGAAP